MKITLEYRNPTASHCDVAAVATTFSRNVDILAETMAEDLLREPKFREDMRELIRLAFAQTLQELRTEKTDGQ